MMTQLIHDAVDISQLQNSHPGIHQEFMDGNFGMKSVKTFNQISTDLALEYVNEVGKVAGGLNGIIHTDSA